MANESSSDIEKLTTCENCGASDPNLLKVDSGLLLTMSSAGRTDIPSAVCKKCLKELKKSASQGAQMMAKQEAKHQMRTELWNNRISLVKQGRHFMQKSEYAESAVSYEKYLKVVSIVAKVDRKELGPKEFNDNPKEITIIASVLWDLMLIYDSHPKFRTKHTDTATTLARFLRFSPIYNGIIRKAELETRRAKNPQAFHQLLKLCDAEAARCFIANSAFGTRTDPTVVTLCQFRDQILKPTALGRRSVFLYYKCSPGLARRLDRRPLIKSMARGLLRGVAFVLKLTFNLPERRDS